MSIKTMFSPRYDEVFGRLTRDERYVLQRALEYYIKETETGTHRWGLAIGMRATLRDFINEG